MQNQVLNKQVSIKNMFSSNPNIEDWRSIQVLDVRCFVL